MRGGQSRSGSPSNPRVQMSRSAVAGVLGGLGAVGIPPASGRVAAGTGCESGAVSSWGGVEGGRAEVASVHSVALALALARSVGMTSTRTVSRSRWGVAGTASLGASDCIGTSSFGLMFPVFGLDNSYTPSPVSVRWFGLISVRRVRLIVAPYSRSSG